MTAIINYSTLIQAAKNKAEDDGTEFSNYLPTAIDLAEERIFRELDLPELEDKATGSLVPNTPLLTKPTGYEFAEYFTIFVSESNNIVLRKKRESFLRDYWAGTGIEDTGVPKYYADASSTTFRIAPTPESNYGYEIKYTKKPDKLTQDSDTNYYTQNCPDILFYAVMKQMSEFMKAWSQVPVFEQDYVQARDTWNLQMARYRRDGGVKAKSMNTGPNSLKHTVNTNA